MLSKIEFNHAKRVLSPLFDLLNKVYEDEYAALKINQLLSQYEDDGTDSEWDILICLAFQVCWINSKLGINPHEKSVSALFEVLAFVIELRLASNVEGKKPTTFYGHLYDNLYEEGYRKMLEIDGGKSLYKLALDGLYENATGHSGFSANVSFNEYTSFNLFCNVNKELATDFQACMETLAEYLIVTAHVSEDNVEKYQNYVSEVNQLLGEKDCGQDEWELDLFEWDFNEIQKNIERLEDIISYMEGDLDFEEFYENNCPNTTDTHEKILGQRAFIVELMRADIKKIYALYEKKLDMCTEDASTYLYFFLRFYDKIPAFVSYEEYEKYIKIPGILKSINEALEDIDSWLQLTGCTDSYFVAELLERLEDKSYLEDYLAILDDLETKLYVHSDARDLFWDSLPQKYQDVILLGAESLEEEDTWLDGLE